MNKRLEELARRKALLISQCAHEREEIASLYKQVRLSFSLTSLWRGLGRGLSAHPMITAAISGLFVSGYAAKMTNPMGQLLKLWRLAPPLWSWWSRRRLRK